MKVPHTPTQRVAPAETKAFPTADVLGAITGRLLGKIDGVYELLSWMTDGPVWTHQLPRVGREASPVVLSLHPELRAAVLQAEHVTPDNWQQWLAVWIDRYGPEITVPRFTEDQHERIDPLSELAEKMHPDLILVVSANLESDHG
jgi:hypothetical protein